MAGLPTLKSTQDLVRDWIVRVRPHSDKATYFGGNSVLGAFGFATASLASRAYLLFTGLKRRFTLQSASGDGLTEVAAERGVDRDLTTRSKMWAIITPVSTTVTAITIGATDLIEVSDSTSFAATNEIRITSEDGSTTETAIIIAVTSGTGPNSGDELEVATLTSAYSPTTETVTAMRRVTVAANTQLDTSAGIGFTTLEAVTTTNNNPVLRGQSSSLLLADIVEVRATVGGKTGNVPGLSITDFTTPIDGIQEVKNPAPGTGGLDEESDFDLKYRTAHLPTILNAETLSWFETLAVDADAEVLRAISVSEREVGSMRGKILRRNGGTFTDAELAQLATYMAARVRSNNGIELESVSLTAVDVVAKITLDPDTTLLDVFTAAADNLANYLDYRKWPWGENVDEADLLSIVNRTTGVASLETSTFEPASDVEVADDSLPVLLSLSLQDIDSGDTINADLTAAF